MKATPLVAFRQHGLQITREKTSIHGPHGPVSTAPSGHWPEVLPEDHGQRSTAAPRRLAGLESAVGQPCKSSQAIDDQIQRSPIVLVCGHPAAVAAGVLRAHEPREWAGRGLQKTCCYGLVVMCGQTGIDVGPRTATPSSEIGRAWRSRGRLRGGRVEFAWNAHLRRPSLRPGCFPDSVSHPRAVQSVGFQPDSSPRGCSDPPRLVFQPARFWCLGRARVAML